MKSKDLIRLLQKEDPEGECHVRTSGGAVYDVERKPGYWDGMYRYIDEEGNFVISTEGDKIDIDSITLETWVWEGREDKVKFDLTYLDNGEHEKEIREEIKKQVEERDRFKDKLMRSSVYDIMKRMRDGFKIIQKEDKWAVFFVKGLEKKQLLLGEVQTLTDSKLFKLVKDEWKLI